MRTLRTVKVAENLKDVDHCLVIMSGKGGVGKSTVAVNLAASFSVKSRVGLLDCDIHGPSIPKLLGMSPFPPEASEEGIYPLEKFKLKVMSIAFLLPETGAPVIWRGPMKMKIIRDFLGKVKWGSLDYLIIDLPPGTGDEPLSIAQLISRVDGTIIVTTPQDVALLSVKRSIAFARMLHMPILGIIENMSGFVCPHCQKRVDVFGYGGGKKAAEELKIPFLGRIPLDTDIVQSGEEGNPFVQKDSPSSRVFTEIVESIEKELEKKR